MENHLIRIDGGQAGICLLSVPPHIAAHAHDYQMQFDKWLFSPDSDHDYRQIDPADGEVVYCYDGAEAFTAWLNEFVLRDSAAKARILPSSAPDSAANLPTLYF